MGKFENFVSAFQLGCSSIHETCECGKVYYDISSKNDFDEGEFEELENNPNAFGDYHSVGRIAFEGKEYALDCDCWKPRAQVLMNFIDTHNYQIANYLNAEKKRKIEEAQALPGVG